MRVLEQNHDDQALHAMSGRWTEAEKLRTISVELVDLLQLHIPSPVEAHDTVGDVQQLFDIMFILRNTLTESLERCDSSKKKDERSQNTFYDESLADSEDSQDGHSSEDSYDLVCDSFPQPAQQSVNKPKFCELRSKTLWKVGDRVEMRCRVSWKWRPGTVTSARLDDSTVLYKVVLDSGVEQLAVEDDALRPITSCNHETDIAEERSAASIHNNCNNTFSSINATSADLQPDWKEGDAVKMFDFASMQWLPGNVHRVHRFDWTSHQYDIQLSNGDRELGVWSHRLRRVSRAHADRADSIPICLDSTYDYTNRHGYAGAQDDNASVTATPTHIPTTAQYTSQDRGHRRRSPPSWFISSRSETTNDEFVDKSAAILRTCGSADTIAATATNCPTNGHRMATCSFATDCSDPSQTTATTHKRVIAPVTTTSDTISSHSARLPRSCTSVALNQQKHTPSTPVTTKHSTTCTNSTRSNLRSLRKTSATDTSRTIAATSASDRMSASTKAAATSTREMMDGCIVLLLVILLLVFCPIMR